MTTYDSHPHGGLERRSQANELDGAHPRSGAAGRRRGRDRADRQRHAEAPTTTTRRPTRAATRRPTAAAQPPDDIKDAVKDGYYVVQEGDNFTHDRRERTCVSEDRLQQLNPEPRPVRAPAPELRRPGRGRMQGARRRLSAAAPAPLATRARPARAGRRGADAASRRRPTPPAGCPRAPGCSSTPTTARCWPPTGRRARTRSRRRRS